jgi:hypothetical protein
MIPIALGVLKVSIEMGRRARGTHLMAAPIPAKARVTTRPAPEGIKPPIKVHKAAHTVPA